MLKVNIDGDWTSDDFLNLFVSLNLLYKLLNILGGKYPIISYRLDEIQLIDGQLYKRLNFSSTADNLSLIESRDHHFTKDFLSNDRIEKYVFAIYKIQYASPGFADFVGIGKIVQQIFSLLRYYFPNEKDRLQNKLIEQDIIHKKIENLKEIGAKDKDMQKIIDIRNTSILNIRNLKLSDKITDIEVKEIE